MCLMLNEDSLNLENKNFESLKCNILDPTEGFLLPIHVIENQTISTQHYKALNYY